jgi:uncharacterized protein (DUF433 family)
LARRSQQGGARERIPRAVRAADPPCLGVFLAHRECGGDVEIVRPWTSGYEPWPPPGDWPGSSPGRLPSETHVEILHRVTEPAIAFTAEQVCSLTGLTARQLAYWDRLKFFAPEHYSDPGKYGRIYSFRDVVGLRTIAQLRETVSLQHLRSLGEWLRDNLTEHEAPWASLRFYVVGKQVVFVDPRTETPTSSRPPGQMVFEIVLSEIANEVRADVERLRARRPEDEGRITRNRHVLHNRPILAGTRIPTSAIWNFHEAGYDTEHILHEYPDLTTKDIEQAIEHERSHHQKRAAG